MKWLKRIALGVVAVVVIAAAGLYGGSEFILRRSHAAPLDPIAVPRDAVSIAEGARIARIVGCRGCHAPNGEGRVLVDVPMVGRVVPPPIAAAAASYSDAELARLIRHGVRRDGRGVFVMPAFNHTNLSDADTAMIIAWIRTLRPTPADIALRTRFGPLGRALILTGALPIQVTTAVKAPARRPADAGRYFTDVICNDCHALHEERPAHDGNGMAPPLAPMAAAYDPDSFRRLLRTGRGLSPRDLGLMAEVSRGDFVAFTDAEIAAIHAYLRKAAEAAPPQ